MRWRMADFWALFSVMMISSRRVGPRLPAMVKCMTRSAHES
jgi:hypothetical protein